MSAICSDCGSEDVVGLGEKLSRIREIAHPFVGEKVSRLTDLLVDAVSSSGLSEKEAAISQGYDPRYWPRVKSGEKAAHLERIAGLPEGAQRAFVSSWGRQLGMRVSLEDSRQSAVIELAEAALRALRSIG
jgi:hypothetical protein